MAKFLSLGFITLLSLPTAFGRPTSGQKIVWVPCEDNIPVTLQGVVSNTTVLPSNLKCGTLQVPMDYSKPIGPANNITLGFAMYRPQKPRGLVNYNAGGPGDEVRSAAWLLALNASDAFTGLENFDFLAMDARGTYSSNVLSCPATFDIGASLPATEVELETLQSHISALAYSCANNTTPAGITEHVGSVEVAHDWNSLRMALGYETMSMLHYSYGTYQAQLYATYFPDNVGRVVLDGVYPVNIANQDLINDQIKAVNRLLLRADAYCMQNTSCPFHSQEKGSVPAAFQTVISMATNGTYGNTTADDIRVGTYFLYFQLDPDFMDMTEALYAAINGNATYLSFALLEQEYSQGAPASIPILCLDTHIENNTFAGLQSMRDSMVPLDPAGFQFTQSLQVMYLCSGWPYAPSSPKTIPTIHKPMTVVTSDFDLNTPVEMAILEFSLAPESTLIVRHGDDHGTFYVPGPARSIEFEYLATGRVCGSTNETLVTVYKPGDKFGAIADPYEVPIGVVAGDGLSPPV